MNLNFCVLERLVEWLSKGVVKTVNSSIVDHLVQTGNSVSVSKSFLVVYRVSNLVQTSVQLKVLQTAEASHLDYKTGAVYRRYIQLLLPWPTEWLINH